jgi:hypothetical protein
MPGAIAYCEAFSPIYDAVLIRKYQQTYAHRPDTPSLSTKHPDQFMVVR